MKIISWNIGHRAQCWGRLLETDADIALLQEAAEPPPAVAGRIEVDPAPWRTAGADTTLPRSWRTAVVKLTDGTRVNWIDAKPIAHARDGELAVSRLGTIAAAHVMLPGHEPFVCLSMYSLWERPHECADSSWSYADAAAHRVVSDLSQFIGRETGHRIIAAGDLNVLHGHGEHGSTYWSRRYETALRDQLMALGDDVQEKRLKYYVAFKRMKNFACVEVPPNKGTVTAFLRVNPDSVSPDEKGCRDVRKVGHYGTGDLEITLQELQDVERFARCCSAVTKPVESDRQTVLPGPATPGTSGVLPGPATPGTSGERGPGYLGGSTHRSQDLEDARSPSTGRRKIR